MSKKETPIELARETLIGDLINAQLQELRQFKDWQEMKEDRQEVVIARIRMAVKEAARQAVSILASEKPITTKGKVDYVKFKDGEASAMIKGFGEGFHDLADYTGRVMIVIPGNEDLTDQADDVGPDPDQSELGIDPPADDSDLEKAA